MCALKSQISLRPLPKFQLFHNFNDTLELLDLENLMLNQKVITYRPDILQKCKDLLPKRFHHTLDSTKGIIAGGALLYVLGLTKTYGDFDLFCLCRNNTMYSQYDNFFKKTLLFADDKVYKINSVDNQTYKKNNKTQGIFQIIQFSSNVTFKKHKRISFELALEIIFNFDLALCRRAITYDGYLIEWNAGPQLIHEKKEQRLQKYNDRIISNSPASLQIQCLDSLKRLKRIENIILLNNKNLVKQKFQILMKHNKKFDKSSIEIVCGHRFQRRFGRRSPNIGNRIAYYQYGSSI
jgi:hypothetical protein